MKVNNQIGNSLYFGRFKDTCSSCRDVINLSKITILNKFGRYSCYECVPECDIKALVMDTIDLLRSMLTILSVTNKSHKYLINLLLSSCFTL